jgi:hypothetical protein
MTKGASDSGTIQDSRSRWREPPGSEAGLRPQQTAEAAGAQGGGGAAAKNTTQKQNGTGEAKPQQPAAETAPTVKTD